MVKLSLLKIMTFVLGHIPLSLARFTGKIFGAVAYRVLSRHRRTALSNLERAFPGLSQAERERIAKGVFRNLAMMFFEFTRIPWLTPARTEELLEFRGLENFDRALEKGRGVILLTGHFGNWELLACLARRGYALDIVVREIDNPVFEALVKWTRTKGGNKIIYKRKAMRKLIKSLASNSIVAILADQNVTHREGVFVDFFGVPACTNKGPALLAQATGAAVVPAFVVRTETGYRLEVGEEIELSDTGDRDTDAGVNTKNFTAVIEEMIRRHPDQWFWVHRRWKTRPEAHKQPAHAFSGQGSAE